MTVTLLVIHSASKKMCGIILAIWCWAVYPTSHARLTAQCHSTFSEPFSRSSSAEVIDLLLSRAKINLIKRQKTPLYFSALSFHVQSSKRFGYLKIGPLASACSSWPTPYTQYTEWNVNCMYISFVRKSVRPARYFENGSICKEIHSTTSNPPH